MQIDLTQLVLLGVLSASLHWLIGRSEIARPLWSRAPGFLGRLLACAGCSGFWLSGIAWTLGVRVVALDARHGGLALGMVLGVFVTPVFESVLLWGLRESAIEPEPDVAPPPEPPSHPSQDSYVTPVDNPIKRVPR
jgi:hypothetical protein